MAILNAGAGRATFTNLTAFTADYGSNEVRAFMFENEAWEWLRAGSSLLR